MGQCFFRKSDVSVTQGALRIHIWIQLGLDLGKGFKVYFPHNT